MKKILLASLVISSSLYSKTLIDTLTSKEEIEYIDFGFKSYHLKEFKDYKYNEFNLGVFINYKNNLSLGYLHKNSYRNKSFIIGYNHNFYNKNDFRIDSKIFLSSGYKGTAGDNKEYVMKTDKLTKKTFGMLLGSSINFSYKNIKLSFNPNPFNLKHSIFYRGFTIKEF